jgi:phosphatidylserine/phosphatidylglycerophosphate/cardiolipin synthase-like enzyme
LSPKVNYRAYDRAVHAGPIDFLADADEYYQDVLASLEDVSDPALFVTGWVLVPSILLSKVKSFEQMVKDILTKPNGRCYILWNANISGPVPQLFDEVRGFYKRVVKDVGAENAQKLKIIISVNLQWDPGIRLWLVNQPTRYIPRRLLPWRKPDSVPPANFFEWAQQLWEERFPQPSDAYRNMRIFTVGSHHQKTLVLSGTRQQAKVLVGYCGGLDFSTGPAGYYKRQDSYNGGLWWHDAAMRVESDMALGLLKNFVERWNFELDFFDYIVSHGVAKTDELAEDDFYSEIDDPLADSVETRRTMPVRVMYSPTQPSLTLVQMAARVWQTEIKRDYLNAIEEAEQWIFIENQYLRHKEIAEALEEQLDDKEALHLTIVLPSYSEEVGKRRDLPQLRARYAAETDPDKQQKILTEVKAKAMTVDPLNKLTLLMQATCLKNLIKHPHVKVWVPRRPTQEPYVHTKMMVVDDTVMLVGSANLNGRSLDGYADSEINLKLTRQEDIRRFTTKMRWRNEPEGEWDPRYSKWSNSDPTPTYYARQALGRYTQRHWEVDLEFGRFPRGKEAILDYWRTIQRMQVMDRFSLRSAERDVEALLDSMPDAALDLDWGVWLMDNVSHLI